MEMRGGAHRPLDRIVLGVAENGHEWQSAISRHAFGMGTPDVLADGQDLGHECGDVRLDGQHDERLGEAHLNSEDVPEPLDDPGSRVQSWPMPAMESIYRRNVASSDT
jgi:hypothetical protein